MNARRRHAAPARRAALGLLLSGLLGVGWSRPAAAQTLPHRFVALSMSVTLDAVGPPDGLSPERHVGEIDHLRLVFDANAIDPVTRRVPLLNLQHQTPNGFDPPRPDPARMPMDDAWLDMSALPYRVHFRAAVNHGAPILIELDDTTRRLSIRAQANARELRLAGPYVIDPTPVTDRTVNRAAERN